MWKYFVIGILLLQAANSQPAKQKSKNEQRATAGQVSPTPIDERQIDISDNPNGANEGQQDKQDNETKAFQRTQIHQYWVLVGTSIITVFLLIAYTVFAGLQWWQIKKQANHASEQVGKMQAQLDAINKQEGHLSVQAEAAKEAADMAKGQLVALQSTERAQHDSVVETRKLVAQNERLLKLRKLMSRRLRKLLFTLTELTLWRKSEGLATTRLGFSSVCG